MDTRQSKYAFLPPGSNDPHTAIETHEKRLETRREEFIAFIVGTFPLNIPGPGVCLTLAFNETTITTVSFAYDEREAVLRHCIDGLPDEWSIIGVVHDPMNWRMAVFTDDLLDTEYIVTHIQPIVEETLLNLERFHANG